MKTRTIPQLKSCFLFALVLNALVGKASSPPRSIHAHETVVLTGWLHVEDLTYVDALVEVEVNGIEQVARVNESGKFTVTLPADAEAVLRFVKPGHIPKEVVVNTHHARDGAAGQKTRRVKFAVIMELERQMAGFSYPRPVGAITFEPQGGCLAVGHDRRLLPPRRQAPMVF